MTNDEREAAKRSARLERVLRRRLLRRTRIVAKRLLTAGGYANYEHEDGPLVIEWDPMQYDLLSLVIHELCHPKAEKELAGVSLFSEETMIEAGGADHETYIRKSSARWSWWYREIKKRLDRTSLRAWLAA